MSEFLPKNCWGEVIESPILANIVLFDMSEPRVKPFSRQFYFSPRILPKNCWRGSYRKPYFCKYCFLYMSKPKVKPFPRQFYFTPRILPKNCWGEVIESDIFSNSLGLNHFQGNFILISRVFAKKLLKRNIFSNIALFEMPELRIKPFPWQFYFTLRVFTRKLLSASYRTWNFFSNIVLFEMSEFLPKNCWGEVIESDIFLNTVLFDMSEPRVKPFPKQFYFTFETFCQKVIEEKSSKVIFFKILFCLTCLSLGLNHFQGNFIFLPEFCQKNYWGEVIESPILANIVSFDMSEPRVTPFPMQFYFTPIVFAINCWGEVIESDIFSNTVLFVMPEPRVKPFPR